MTYLAGHIKVPQEDGTERTEKVVVFSNQNKQNDKQPDYRVYVSNVEKRDGTGATQSSSPQQSQQANWNFDFVFNAKLRACLTGQCALRVQIIRSCGKGMEES